MPDQIAGAREAFVGRRWAAVFDALASAEPAGQLPQEDLVRLAFSAHMLGRDEDFERAMEGAYHAYQETRMGLSAARCAFWLGYHHAAAGRMGLASGWLGRAARDVSHVGTDCVERGYLLVPEAEDQLFAGDYEAAYAIAHRAAEVGERFRDAELIALALHVQGWAMIKQLRIRDGLALLDEAMVAVTADELLPVVTGIVYCGVIEACHEVYALHRAREWTDALSRWCDGQPDLVPYAGQCLVHRAEVMQLRGSWPEALDEARRAADRLSAGTTRPAAAEAHYRIGDVQRLMGNLPAAEEAYREANLLGGQAQPGLALLRLAQGRTDAAEASIRRSMDEATQPLARASLLPAAVDILLATDRVEEARAACAELSGIASAVDSPMLDAVASTSLGAVHLADHEFTQALGALRRATERWQELDAPYHVARVRTLLAEACAALGDHDSATLEREAARRTFERLGARNDLATLRQPTQGGEEAPDNPLAPRERQVLRLLATGKTNKAIAAELVVSERTVDRHVSNILAKLGVATRSAATAYAYEHQLL